MRMDRLSDVGHFTAHLDCQRGLGDELASAGADDADAEHALGVGINEDFSQSLRPTQRDRATTGGPGVNGDFDFAADCLRVLFGESTPGDFRVGKHDGWNRQAIKSDGFAGEHLGGDAAFVRCLVR